MFLVRKFAILILLGNEVFCRTGFSREHVKYYSQSWTMFVSGDDGEVKNIAQKEGFDIVEQLCYFPNLYHIRHRRHPKRSKYENQNLTETLLNHPQVLWAKQEAEVRHELKNTKCPGMLYHGSPKYENALSDELFNSQWYLQECRPSDRFPVYDLNVLPVWYLHNIFGRNVKVLFIDDGVEVNHPDLRDNYDEELGLDLVEGGKIPIPRHFVFRKYAHGTKCAGIVSMRAGNRICASGIAPLATFGAVRLIGDSPDSDRKDAQALTFRLGEVDIMSCSWGPMDDGKTMVPLGENVRLAMRLSINLGREGKGIIYVFPSGNGKEKNDSCGSDAYVNSIYTIAVGGVDYNGMVTWYSERCAAVMAVVYGGDYRNRLNFNIVTTDINNQCTTKFSGTSAAVPVATGIFTLLLEANNELTWRGVQHVIAYTGEIAPLADNFAWYRNGAGFIVGHNFGFGMLDALRMVEFAKTMEPLPPMNSCVLRVKLRNNVSFSRPTVARIHFRTNGCQSLPSEVNYIEHVQLMVSAKYSKRGAIKINLHSPHNTLSHMLESRKRDWSKAGLTNWLMDSVQMWGESPRGEWTVTFLDITGRESYSGFVETLTLIIHGTKDIPPHYKQRRTYYKFTMEVKKWKSN